MKGLLVQSPAASPWVPRRQWEIPSLALATIAAHVENHEVKIADMVVWRKNPKARYLELLAQYRPDMVGFSAMTYQYDTVLRFAYLTKQFDKRIQTVLGGYHATLFNNEIMKSPDKEYWDYIIRGEGDFSFSELLDILANKD